MTKPTPTPKYAGSRDKKLNHLGQAHLLPGMSESRLQEIYARYGIRKLTDLDKVGDGDIDEMIAEVAEIVETERKDNQDV